MTTIFIGELLGTLTLVLLGDSVVANVVLNKTKGQNAGWIVITTGWAFAVLIGIFVSKACGSPAAHLNPSVTVGMAIMGGITWAQAPVFIAAQMIGGFLGAVIMYLHYLPHFKETEDPGAKLAVFSTAPAIRDPATNWLGEIIATFMLVFGIACIFSKGMGIAAPVDAPAELAGVAAGFNQIGSGFGPLFVAFLIWGIGLTLGGTTGYSMNAARDLSPRIVHAILPIPGKGDSDWGYAPIGAFGPIIGAVIAAIAFNALG